MAELSHIRQGMQVKSSDGEVVGHVAPGGGLSVTPIGGGAAHSVSEEWVSRVDEHVHLRHSAAVLRGRWSGNAIPAEAVPTQKGAKVPIILGLIVIAIALVLLFWGFFYSSNDAPRTVEQAPNAEVTKGDGQE